MFEIETTPVFDAWLLGLRDRQALARVEARIFRLAQGNPGDARHLGGGVSELRIHAGPGYRIYWCQRGQTAYLLLCGGDKGSQQADIERARALAAEILAAETPSGEPP